MSATNAAVGEADESAPLDPIREILEDEDGARDYLVEHWVAEAMLTMRRARRQAGLTQAQVAEQLGTQQPAVARLEGDHSGGVSVRRYAEYFAACNVLPFEVEFAPIEQLRQFALDNPTAPLTADALRAWLVGSYSDETVTHEQEPNRARSHQRNGDALSSTDASAALSSEAPEDPVESLSNGQISDLEASLWKMDAPRPSRTLKAMQPGGPYPFGESSDDDFSDLSHVIERVKNYVSEGEDARRKHDYGKATGCYRKALWVLRQREQDARAHEADNSQPYRDWWALRVWVQIELVATDHHRGDVRQAITEAHEGLALVEGRGDLIPQRVRLLAWLAELNDLVGKEEESWARISEAEAVLDAAPDSVFWPKGVANQYLTRLFLLSKPFLQATITRIRGTLKVRSGDWQGAQADFSESMRIAQEAAPTMPEKFGAHVAAYVERDRCRLAVRQGDFLKARDHNDFSFRLRMDLEHGARATAHYHTNMADIYLSTSGGVTDHLGYALFDAIEAFESIDDPLDVARTQRRLARFYRKSKRLRDAEYWARRSLAFCNEKNLPLDEALAHRELGQALERRGYAELVTSLKMEYLQEAEKELRVSLSSLDKLHDRFELAVTQRVLAVSLLLKDQAEHTSDNHAEAKRYLDAALETFKSLGAQAQQLKTEGVFERYGLSSTDGDGDILLSPRPYKQARA